MASLVAGALVYVGVAAGTAASVGTGVALVGAVASVAAAGVSIANALDTPDTPDGPAPVIAPTGPEGSTSSLGVSSVTPSAEQVGEAQRRQQTAIRNKSGRRSTILSGGSSTGPTPGSGRKTTLG